MFNKETPTEWLGQVIHELYLRTKFATINSFLIYTLFIWTTNLYSESQLKVIIGFGSFFILSGLRYTVVYLYGRFAGTKIKNWYLAYSAATWITALAWGLFAGSIFYSRSFDLTSNILMYCTLAFALESLVLHSISYRFFFINCSLLMAFPVVAMGLNSTFSNTPYFIIFTMAYTFLILAGRYLNIEFTNNLRKSSVIKQQKSELDTARSKAIEASKVKSQFLSNMSHEIRTPMNEIIGLTGILLDRNIDSESRRITEVIRDSSENLLTIINDVLDFSKLESGRVELEQQVCDVAHTIESTFLVYESKALEKRIDLDFSVGKNVPRAIITDATRLRQILANLVSNAIKFTETGSVKVVVEVAAEKPSGIELQFIIQDTGIGIPQTRLDRLFKSFSQVDATTARKFGGSGLGLAICKQLSELMGGKIWVKSKFGYGSSFYFTIFAQEAKDVAIIKPGTNKIEKISETFPWQILVAEDNSVDQNVMLKLLEKLGYRADIASNGYEAIEALKRKRYDITLMDVQMPELSGHEATRIICDTWPKGKRPYIIALTATLDEDVKDRCREAGMDNFIVKPVRIHELSKLLKSVPIERVKSQSDVIQIPSPQALWGDLTIDFSQMLRIVGGDKDLLSAAINSFILESESLVQRFETALNARDAVAFENIAHSIKHGASTFIATPIIRHTLDAEKYFKNSQFSAATEAINRLKIDVKSLNQILSEIHRTNLAA